jgi:hypothetical protein
MAYPITFAKSEAEAFLAALDARGDIACPAGGWTAYDMLMLAGCCLCGATSHGPVKRRLDPKHYEDLPPEHREASEETFESDLLAVITICSQLAMLILDDEYDRHFEESVTALVYMDGDQKTMHAIKGVKEGDRST